MLLTLLVPLVIQFKLQLLELVELLARRQHLVEQLVRWQIPSSFI
jgi:hypothetical protein